MGLHSLTLATLGLYCVTSALLAWALVRRAVHGRRRRVHSARVEQLRRPFEACVLDGAPLAAQDEAGRGALLDLAVRYASLVRGAEAARILACAEQQGLVAGLLEDLRSRDAWRRARAADMLGRLRVRRAVQPLVAALRDESEDVRTVAARSLAAIGDATAVPALAGALADPSRWTVSLIAESLMRMGPQATPPLLFLLGSADHNVRVAAVQILGEIRDPRAVEPLAAMVRTDRELNLRAQAAAALGKLGGPRAEEALAAALSDRDWQVRAQAAKALGRLGRAETADLLAEAMPDTHWWVRVNCAEALARLGDHGRRRLAELRRHPDGYVREQAAAALQTYGW